MIRPGDIVRTSYGTGPYKVLSISGPHTHPCYLAWINMRNPPPSRPHYDLTVVPVRAPVDHDRASNYCYLNGYAPTDDPQRWRSVWNEDELYLEAHAARAQLELF